ncbi:non-ribosomal peptide synthetase [Pseudoalteromonas ardens]|uniref:non-ribosomal peptide synthetase n=1 Tax=Pseudoalteromonas ardens TaxID=3048490 RepID=UPI0024C33FB7|nr:non-ribosomal peptide synthetase [Pseudoalteromonas sp. R96]MDK1314050.1 amino acid adenylation domain-containing protein [Pseudoalteromonas sp. R96]
MTNNNNNLVDNGYALSPQQTRLDEIKWASDHAIGSLPNVHCCWRIQGNIDVGKLQGALDRLVEQCEIIRTQYVRPAGLKALLQVINPQAHIVLNLFDWEPEQTNYQQLFAQAELQFDLQNDALLRVNVYQSADQACYLQLIAPAISFDVKGLSSLLEALLSCYLDIPNDEDEVIQMVDVANWLNELQLSDEFAQERAYWQQQPKVSTKQRLKLATEVDPGAATDMRLGRTEFTVDTRAAQQIEEFASQHNLTEESILVTLWQCLLASYSDWQGVSLGVAAESRQEELAEFMGVLCRYLPLVVDYTPDSPVLTVCKENHNRLVAHQDHSEYFNSQAAGYEEGACLARYGFSYTRFATTHLRDLSAVPILAQGSGELFELRLNCERVHDQLRYQLYYDGGLFDDQAIQLIAHRFSQLLTSALALLMVNPRMPLSALDAVSEHEQQLMRASMTPKLALSSYSAPEIFADIVTRKGEQVLLETHNQRFTYAQIDMRAQQLAGYLQAQGIGQEMPVAVCTERNEHLVISLLALLKIGAVYVPLDPQLQAQRIAYIMADTGCKWVLSESSFAAQVGELATCIEVDNWVPQGHTYTPVTVAPEQLAYLIYTSGSTGQPKGVGVSHRALSNYVETVHRRLELTTNASMLALASPATDLGHTALFGAVLTGRTLRMLPSDMAVNADALAQHLKLHPVSCFKIVPSHLRALMSVEEPERLLPTECLVLGGEALPVALVEEIRALRPQLKIVNHYGPTETTVGILTHELAATSLSTSPVGKPLAGAHGYVVDEQGRLAGIGVVGELYLGGDTLARGYWQRPELTAEKFIPDDFSGLPGQRLYRSGDLAYYQADGEIVYVGRGDEQVKLRGFRVELGEIEAVLSQYVDIEQAVVRLQPRVAQPDNEAEGAEDLVAYVVMANKQTLDLEALNAYMASNLADYMRPVAFLQLNTLPLTRSGKVDRLALVRVERQSASRADFQAPTTDMEIRLAALWQALLNLDEVGIDDDFFKIGGQSLLAIRLIAGIRSQFQRELSVRDIFAYPTIRTLAQALQQSDITSLPPILPYQGTDPAPLSFAQQRLWVIEQLQGAGALYNIPFATRVRGRCDIAKIEQALACILERHQVLRTTYVLQDEQPVQQVNPASDFSLSQVDLRHLSNAERELEIAQACQEEAAKPFNLATDTMLRGRVLLCGEQDFVLLLTLHHIASDGVSKEVLMKELGQLYDALSAGVSAAEVLPPLDIQYADYARWQRDWLSGDALDSQLAYWLEQLAELPVTHSMALDRPRPNVMSHQGEELEIWVSEESLQQLKQLAQRHGVTTFMLMHGAFALLLAHHSYQQDIVIGTPVANRTEQAVQSLIGFFVNTLVLRVDVDSELSLAEYLQRIKSVNLAAQEHQDVPFELLVEQLNPERSQQHSPLFQIMLNYLQASEHSTKDHSGLEFEPLSAQESVAKFDLTLTLIEHTDADKGALQCHFSYAKDLFDRTTIAAMAERFAVLLNGLTEVSRLADLPVLPEPELQRLVHSLNNTQVAHPTETLVHRAFEQQAALMPDKVAVTIGTEQMTYQALDEASNRLAHYLISQGVKPNSIVGLCMERSLGLMVGLLGILKAGAAYLPLDPAYPKERLSHMVKDAGLSQVVTLNALKARLPAGQHSITCLDDTALLQACSTQSPSVDATAASMADLCYVIYTSGSTGLPKGTPIAHHNVNNLLQWYIRKYDLTQHDKVIAISGPGFDMSQKNLLAPLMVGASIHFATAAVYDPELIATTIAEQQVTILNCASSAFYPLLEATNQAQDTRLDSLRTVLIGGENLMLPRLTQWLKQTHTRLVHMYGPTEGTDIACTYEVEDNQAEYHTLPIGRPNDNVSLYVMSTMTAASGQPKLAPFGCIGELYIGGQGVVKGYLNRPELTEQRFIPDPFSSDSTARLYRTGDLVRYLPEGNLEFVGRIDDQVQIQGFRVELGEIEQQISAHESVDSCLVMAREDSAGHQRLIAYVIATTSHEEAELIKRIRLQLHQVLPEYMVPAAFAILTQWPLTPNGKIDRKALPEPDLSQQQGAYVAPQTQTEHFLVAAWAELLSLPSEQLSISGDFFALGGHSLLMVRLMTKVKNQFSLELSLESIYREPTIEAIASLIDLAHSKQTVQQELEQQELEQQELEYFEW